MTEGSAAALVIAVGAGAYSFGWVSAAFGLRLGTRVADGLYRLLVRRLRARHAVRQRARYAPADVREPGSEEVGGRDDFDLWREELDLADEG